MDITLAEKLLSEMQTHFKGGIYHYTQINLCYNSNHIEGNQLTEEQTRYIYETRSLITNGDSSTSIDDIMETINHFKCFDYIIENYKQTLNSDFIKHLHYLLKSNTSAEQTAWFEIGKYKSQPNFVGDIKTSSPKNVEKDIDQLLRIYNSNPDCDIEKIVDFHYKFECIHPFQDGNGRVGRLLMFKECLRNNIVPFIISDKQKAFYYRGLREYEHQKGYLQGTCLLCQDDYTDVIKYFMEQEAEIEP